MILASDKTAYKRMGAQNTPEKLKNLERIKGITSFENEKVAMAPKENIIESVVTSNFIKDVIPEATTEKWLKKQMLIVEDKPTVAGVLIFSYEPQALLPKHCGIKIYRYKTSEESNRSFLHDQPITIEGDLYTQIHKSVSETKKIVSSIPKLGDGKSEFVRYPTETLHEILTNAVLHRDYEIKDDIHIRIYDNRVEIQSPGKLPAHITIENILDERYARNGNIVRILNKFKNPPNKDVGEDLNTAFSKMKELGLREPEIRELQNNVLVIIKHESLSSPSEMILEYLKKNESIKNAKARLITGVKSEHKIKQIFKQMSLANQIEKIPDTKTSATAWRIVKK